jgi:hypothetical protein
MITKAEGVTDRYVRRIIELAFLAPDITQMILEGRQPADMSTEWLVRGADLPLDWREQRQVLGLPRLEGGPPDRQTEKMGAAWPLHSTDCRFPFAVP